MWLFNSSIGRKFVMALTGICLVLFVTFHVLMNAVAICCPVAYNKVCLALGANWYALVASMGLGLLFIVHIIYALVLTVQNRKARGNDRYAVSARPKSVEWSSQNMLVLGIVVLAFLGVHIVQFWARMQAQEVMGSLYTYEGVQIPAAAGSLFLQIAFQSWWTPVVYIIGFAALWFHMNHGFWSMWQSCGWDNQVWLPRWKKIACWWVTIVIGLFTIQAIVFTVRANQNYYLTDSALMNQYQEMFDEHFEVVSEPLTSEMKDIQRQAQQLQNSGDMFTNQIEMQKLNERFMEIRSQLEQMYAEHNDNITRLMDLANAKETAAAPAEAAAPALEPTEE